MNKLTSVAFGALLLLSGCGGNDDDVEWQEGVFQSEDNFKDLCQSPRSGTDPFNGNQPYPDSQGSLLDELNWIRSWNNNTYLWYDEVIDRNPADYNSTLNYFDVLKTFATTPSGAPKDQFHFTADTAEYNASAQSGQSAGYGAEWAIVSATPPRKIVIAFTESNTPAANANLSRGAEILEIDGIDVVNDNTQAGVNILNAGLFPSASGEQHTFVVRDLGATNTRSLTLTSETITSDPVLQSSVFNTNSGKMGYMVFNTFGTFSAEQQLLNSFNQFATEAVDDLVIDLRYNGGGFVAISSQLAYMIAGDASTAGKTYNRSRFNDKHPTVNPVTGQVINPTPFYDETLGFSVTSGQALPSLNLNRVFVLSTGRTCSASELLVNGLRGAGIEVILIGGTTCGKPYGFYPTDNCGTTYFTIQFQAENHLGFGDYPDGFSPANTPGVVGEVVPGCSVADDFDNLLGSNSEALLSAAIQYADTSTCPTPTGTAVLSKMSTKNGLSLFDSPHYRARQAIKNNLINLKPN